MWTDVLDLNEFYSSTQGQMTVRLLRSRLREVWPSVRGETVLGLGYATPFLRPFREEAARTLAFMPAQQGVTRWPREGANHTAFVDEMDLPLPGHWWAIPTRFSLRGARRRWGRVASAGFGGAGGSRRFEMISPRAITTGPGCGLRYTAFDAAGSRGFGGRVSTALSMLSSCASVWRRQMLTRSGTQMPP